MRELNAFAGADFDTPAPPKPEPSLLKHPLIGSGIAIAPFLSAWGDLNGGVSVHFIAIAAVTLEVIRDWLERASSLAGRSSRGLRPHPRKPHASRDLSGDEGRRL